MSDHSKDSILVVDDDPTILKLVSLHLQHHGFHVATLLQASTLLEQVKQLEPDLILLDVMMPNVDGFEICRRLKADKAARDIPIIFLTALTDLENKLKGFEAGGVDYLTKPVRLAELEARVNTHLTLRRLQQQINDQNERLKQEVARRRQAEKALKAANEALTNKVKARTADLEAANASLKQEILERRQAEAALWESHTRYHNLAANIPGMIYQFLLQSNGKITFPYVSPGSRIIYELEPEVIQDNPQRLIEVIHPDDAAHFHESVQRSAETLQPWHWIGRIIVNGQTKWVRGGSRPEKQADGAILWDGLLIDITERKQLEEHLYQIQRMETVGQLAGGVAHNFNNLLTAIMGYVGLSLQTLPADHPVVNDLQGIQKSARRGANLARQLLTFTRNQTIQTKEVDLNEIVREMEQMLRQFLTEAIDLKTHLAPDLGWVKVDVSQFEQVLVNLALNARDAMPGGGRLSIETKPVRLDPTSAGQYKISPGDYALLTVSDTGVGMTESVLAHIFEPFFTTKEVDQGTGLGLSICFGVIKQHKGHIVVDSRPERGTTFKIFLPRIEPATPSSPLNIDEVDDLPRGSETILLVEDEADLRELMARFLRQQGYTVWEARDGENALQIIEAKIGETLHLLLTDIVMPRMGGIYLAKRLKAKYPALKVLFMSGHNNEAAGSQDESALETPFLIKPYTPARLVRKVRSVLDNDR